MYIYELADILLFIKSIKHPSDKFDMLTLLSYYMICWHKPIMNSYFYRLPRL